MVRKCGGRVFGPYEGTQSQRVFEQAKGFRSGKPLELHVVKGTAKERRQLIVESVEKSR
jgi:hypothetical protein